MGCHQENMGVFTTLPLTSLNKIRYTMLLVVGGSSQKNPVACSNTKGLGGDISLQRILSNGASMRAVKLIYTSYFYSTYGIENSLLIDDSLLFVGRGSLAVIHPRLK
jgi:hypothetical protein